MAQDQLSVEKLSDKELAMIGDAEKGVADAKSAVDAANAKLENAKQSVRISHGAGFAQANVACGRATIKSVELRGQFALVSVSDFLPCGGSEDGGFIIGRPGVWVDQNGMLHNARWEDIHLGTVLPVIPEVNSWKDSVMKSWEDVSQSCSAVRAPGGDVRWDCGYVEPGTVPTQADWLWNVQ